MRTLAAEFAIVNFMAKSNRIHSRSTAAYKSKNFSESLQYATRGMVRAVSQEVNIRVQIFLLLLAVCAWWLLGLKASELAVILSVGAGTLILELLNSALEALADAVHPQYSLGVQAAKDMAAGAVLIMSMVALVAGVVIFGSHLLDLALRFASFR